RARHKSWELLEQSVLDIPAPLRVDDNQEPWPVSDINDAHATEVLTAVKHLPAHMQLAAFALGAHTCHFEGTARATFSEHQHLPVHRCHLRHLTSYRCAFSGASETSSRTV